MGFIERWVTSHKLYPYLPARIKGKNAVLALAVAILIWKAFWSLAEDRWASWANCQIDAWAFPRAERVAKQAFLWVTDNSMLLFVAILLTYCSIVITLAGWDRRREKKSSTPDGEPPAVKPLISTASSPATRHPHDYTVRTDEDKDNLWVGVTQFVTLRTGLEFEMFLVNLQRVSDGHAYAVPTLHTTEGKFKTGRVWLNKRTGGGTSVNLFYDSEVQWVLVSIRQGKPVIPHMRAPTKKQYDFVLSAGEWLASLELVGLAGTVHIDARLLSNGDGLPSVADVIGG